MSAWGPGVFADDLACEIRDAYRDLLADGHSATQAKDAVIRNWGQFLNDVDTGPVIWLALAVTQWKLGQIDENTRDRALTVINSGEALRPWAENRRWLKKRQSVLNRIKVQLESPQPPPRKLKKRFKDSCEWERGELISYQTRSGKFVVFRVIGHHTDRGGTSPIIELLDWLSETLPSAEEIKTIPIRYGKLVEAFGLFPAHHITQLFVGRLNHKELPQNRLWRLGIKSEPTQKVTGFTGAGWNTLDAQLADIFGIE